MPDDAPSDEQVRDALQALLSWQSLVRSPQLSELLRYVVEKTLAGDDAAIKAYSVAVDVFGRPQSFDPQSDPIVRVQARRLRSLLEQYYESGENHSPVEIRLPLGRYVPEFRLTGMAAAVAGPAAVGRPATGGLRRFYPPIVGFCLTIIAAGLVVAVTRALLPAAPMASGVPDAPHVTIGTFDNLTGDDDLNAAVKQLEPDIAAGLSKFDTLTAAAGEAGNGLLLRGVVQKSDGQYDVRAILSQGTTSGIIWSTTISPSASASDAEALSAAAAAVVVQLASPRGPLHAPGRAWLAQQAAFPAQPNTYVCELQYMVWRDSRRLEDALDGIGCFGKVLVAEPDNGIALASDAALRAWRTSYEANPGDAIGQRLADEVTEAALAAKLLPQSSFVYEQQALVLARQGSIVAALGALGKSEALNPANMDAKAIGGLFMWLAGDWDKGVAASEEAIVAAPSPPPWYYMTRAFDALRQRRYFDAIDAAQALSAGDDEFGPALALAAAPNVGRNDLIDRYRPLVLGNPRFQSGGILPRLSMLARPAVLLERLREGLTLAGIPPAALDGPFNPDGTKRG